jgi:hypothetical protein
MVLRMTATALPAMLTDNETLTVGELKNWGRLQGSTIRDTEAAAA